MYIDGVTRHRGALAHPTRNVDLHPDGSKINVLYEAFLESCNRASHTFKEAADGICLDSDVGASVLYRAFRVLWNDCATVHPSECGLKFLDDTLPKILCL